MPLRGIEAVVLDFYGTLASGSYPLERAIDNLLPPLRAAGLVLERDALLGAYRRQVEAYIAARAATGDEQHNTTWVAAALRELGHASSATDAPVVAAVDSYFRGYVEALTLLPGVEEALESLSGTHVLGLLSNFTDARPVRSVLERHGLEDRFRCVYISAERGRCKPHADAFLSVLAELGVAAERALFVGDDPEDDVRGAAAVGMRTAWIQGSDAPPLLRWIGGAPVTATADADVTLASVAELPALLATVR